MRHSNNGMMQTTGMTQTDQYAITELGAFCSQYSVPLEDAGQTRLWTLEKGIMSSSGTWLIAVLD